MDTDDGTIGRIFTRRAALAAMARAGVGFAIGGTLARTAQAARTEPRPSTRPTGLVAAPALTEGPFFVEERLDRSDLVAGSTRPSVVGGVPLDLSITVYRMVGDKSVCLQGAHVELWHCDAVGIYSDESDPMNNEVTSGQRWLRGYQVAGNDGRVRFQTIVPGWYSGRAPHIHFKVRQEVKVASGAITRPFRERGQSIAEFTSQLYFRESDLAGVYTQKPYRGIDGLDTANVSDGIYSERLADGSPAGSHLLLNLQPTEKGRSAEFAILLTDASFEGQRHFGRPPRGGRPDDDLPWWAW